ncbi:MAG: type II toxin-antitoxin system CcdA family antitoxin [Acetobacteraceae bacterium]|nr:type II toxin-antitoxin system CcdA family antitoxin [Acetobacteraceae bacterium]
MKLEVWLAETGTRPADLARRCGVNIVTVYKWRSGTIFPRPAQLTALAEATQGAVTANDFVPADTSRTVQPARREATGFGETQAPLLPEARALGLDPDAIAAAALRKAISDEKARRWAEENREAIEAHNRYVEEHGLPLEEYRMF